RVRVVDARWVHEAARARRLECLGELADLESPDVRRNRDEAVRSEEVGDLLETRLVGGEKVRLIRRDACRARRIGRREAGILEHRLERAITGELHLAERGNVAGIEGQ